MNLLTFYKLENHNCIQVFGIKIKFKPISPYPFLKLIIEQYIKFRLRFLKYKFRIIPIGQYCMPRVIATLGCLKPRKKNGELTCPFDLAFFNDFDKIIELIDTRFVNFNKGLSYNYEKNWWENKRISAIYNHDGLLSQEEFVSRYNRRINNFRNYASENSSFKFFLFATFQEVSQLQIEHCLEALHKIVNSDNFKLIIINQTNKFMIYESDKVSIINQNHNSNKFAIVNKYNNWVEELSTCYTKAAFQIYREISLAI